MVAKEINLAMFLNICMIIAEAAVKHKREIRMRNEKREKKRGIVRIESNARIGIIGSI